MTVGAFFQCYKNYKATEYALKAFRAAYPTSTIVLLSDNGYDYSKFVDEYNVLYFHETRSCPSFDTKDTEKQKLCIQRWQQYLPLIKEDYFMILEDDVLVLKPYEEPFLGTINGNCINCMSSELFKKIPDSSFLPETKVFYSGHGGSVYHKIQFLHAISNQPRNDFLFTNWHSLGLGPAIDFDVLCSLLVLLDGGNIHHMKTHKDRYTNTNSLFDAHVLHQFKDLYER